MGMLLRRERVPRSLTPHAPIDEAPPSRSREREAAAAHAEHAHALEQLEKRHEEQIATLEAGFQEVMDEEVAKARGASEEACEKRLEDLARAHAKEIAEVRRACEESLAESARVHDEEIERLTRATSTREAPPPAGDPRRGPPGRGR